jgi:hypothetical protein
MGQRRSRRHDRGQVSIFHLRRHAPTFGAGGADRRGDFKASLGFPDQARDRYPAVIVVHGLGGYRDSNEGYRLDLKVRR